VTLGVITSTIHRRNVDIKKVKEVRTKMGELRKEMSQARKKGNKRAYAKLQRKQKMMMRESSKVMAQQSKVMLFTMFPFMGLFYFLNWLFGPARPVAFSPIDLPYGTIDPSNVPYEGLVALPFWTWYFLAAISVNMPLNRHFRIYG